jgi:membrane-associated phospholipid phosphatase
MNKPFSPARASIKAAALFGLVALAYFFADRPLAEALRPHFAGERIFVWLTYISKPLTPAATILIVAVAFRGIARGSLTVCEFALLRISCAILLAGVFTYELKEVFGRTWPETWLNNNPSYFGNGVYGFFPFHGGPGYAAFPSGHTTAICAFAGALWFLWPRLRWLGVALAVAVAIGLLGANYHWLSDIMAGAIVGVTTGWAAARIAHNSSPRGGDGTL